MSDSDWEKFRSYHLTYASEGFKRIMLNIENLAASTTAVLRNTTEEDRKAVYARAERITDQISNLVAGELPLVASLSLITAISAYEQVIRKTEKPSKRTKSKK